MRINEVLGSYYPGKYGMDDRSILAKRFAELGIGGAEEEFLGWVYHGKFNLNYFAIDKYEQTFWLINSILPDEIIESYSRLPKLYRGFRVNNEQLAQIFNGGLPIQSKVSSWAPFKVAKTYVGDTSGVLLSHQPKGPEVVLSLTNETCEFLHLSRSLVINPMETILSLPILKITPDLVFSLPAGQYANKREYEQLIQKS